MTELPPLSLYIHVPWCVRKCPYCDFNSHGAEGDIPEAAYVDALLADLEAEAPAAAGRPLESVFIGGGTPSLLSGDAMHRLLDGVRARLGLPAGAEVTLEANPGTAERARFAGYREAGVNRLSLGVQSLDPGLLQALGRIHGPEDAVAAVAAARSAGFEEMNLDLMFALPGQGVEQAALDVETAIELGPEHLSYYQLTIEPHTAFHHDPPELPDEETAWAIQEAGQARLAAAGFRRYEVSAYARPGHECAHNLNYWRFGDYLGIGAGAHGKVTDKEGHIVRRWKRRHPRDYLAAPAAAEERPLDRDDRIVEFMMNALRLSEGFEGGLFEARTGLSLATIAPQLEQAEARGLLERGDGRIRTTADGARLLDGLLQLFLPQ